MPFPRSMARFNRVFPNPIARRVVGKIPPFALLIHRGRTSGREYRTPLMAVPTGDGFVIALTYGRHTDWQRNVVKAGGCELIYRGQPFLLTDPHVIGKDEASGDIPLPIRIVLCPIGVNDYLRLSRT